MKKSLILAAASLAAVSLSLTACNKKTETAGNSSTQAQKVVRINFQTGSLCGAPVHVAWKLGLFD